MITKPDNRARRTFPPRQLRRKQAPPGLRPITADDPGCSDARIFRDHGRRRV